MTPQELELFWAKATRVTALRQPLGPACARELLEAGLTDWQLQWLITEYMKRTAFPTAQDLWDYVAETQAAVPDDLVCGAHLSGHPQVIALADELETLDGAWFEDEAALERAANLKATLKEVLR